MNFKKETFKSVLEANLDFQFEPFSGSEVGLAFPLKLIDFQRMAPISVPQECVGTHGPGISQTCLSEMAKTGVWNLVQLSPEVQGGLQTRIQMANSVVQSPQTFLENPAEVILGPSGQKIKQKTWELRSSNQKQAVLNKVQAFLSQIPKFGAIRNSVSMIADELLTNAIFNAPFEDPNYTLDRNTLVVLDPGMSAQLTVAYTAERLFVGCFDSFGTFDCQNLLDRISQYSSDGMSSVNMGIGGAGVGLMRVIYLSSELYVVVEEGRRTLVGCSLPLEGSLKKVLTAPKSFFFQSFKNFDSETSSCRIEKRGHHILVRVGGKLERTSPANYMDILSAQDVTFDFRLLKTVDEGALDQLIGVFKGAPGIKTVNIDYVPYDLADAIFPMEKRSGNLVRVKSIWASLECPKCKEKQDIVLKRTVGEKRGEKPGEKGKGAHQTVKCQGCGQDLGR